MVKTGTARLPENRNFVIVCEFHGQQSPATCSTIIRGVGVTGGSADFDIVWENGTESRLIPECLVRGSVQWRILDKPPATAETIQFMREFAESESKQKAAEKMAADKRFADEVAALRKDKKWAHLESFQPGEYASCGRLVAANLRREFKKLWPEVKFSVRKEHHGSVNVDWTDGPIEAEVKKVTGKYRGGYFDGMEDIYRHERSPFTSVFGSVDYLSLNHHHSVAAMREAMLAVCAQYGWAPMEIKQHLDGSAYVGCDDRDRYVKIYDWLEKRHEYEVRDPEPGDPVYEALKAQVAAMEAKKGARNEANR